MATKVADYALPKAVGSAWDEALASDGPVMLEFTVDQQISPVPPHVMFERGKKAAKAALRDPEKVGVAVPGFQQKLVEFYEKLPGRDTE